MPVFENFDNIFVPVSIISFLSSLLLRTVRFFLCTPFFLFSSSSFSLSLSLSLSLVSADGFARGAAAATGGEDEPGSDPAGEGTGGLGALPPPGQCL